MPLRDHFRPPLANQHSWDELHGQWPAMMVLSLGPLLPPQFKAAPHVHLGSGVEIDVGAFQRQSESSEWTANGNGNSEQSTALWIATEPTLSVETEIPDTDEYEVRVYDESRGRTLVATVELVSPANKDRPETRSAFVTKCVALLQRHVSVTIIDVVTSRDCNLYAELLEFLGKSDASVSVPPSSIYAVACRGFLPRGRWTFQAWHRPLSIGQPLPTLPLWIADDLAVSLDLETTYEQTCRAVRIA